MLYDILNHLIDPIKENNNMADLSEVYKNLKPLMDALDLKQKQNVGTLTTHLGELRKSVELLTNYISKQSQEKEVSDKKSRELEDEVDDYKQKNLSGKFVITCDKNKPSPMKTQEDLATDGGDKDLPAHIVHLAQEKYGVTLKPEDISGCHFLPKGGIFFSLWNQKPVESPSAKLTAEIKSSKDKDKIVFINFMMTKRRSSLLYEVRQLKKNKQIARYYSDEKGAISIKVKDGDSNIKLASYYPTKTSPVRTYTVQELHKKVSSMQQQ